MRAGDRLLGNLPAAFGTVDECHRSILHRRSSAMKPPIRAARQRPKGLSGRVPLVAVGVGRAVRRGDRSGPSALDGPLAAWSGGGDPSTREGDPMARPPRRLPAGRPPWDPLNGFRVGAFAGAAVGAIVMAIVGAAAIWVVFLGGALGGGIGYWTEKRKQRDVSVGERGEEPRPR